MSGNGCRCSRREFLAHATAGVAALSAGARSVTGRTAGSETVVLEGIDRYRVVDPWCEGVRVVLTYRGEPYSAEYVQGISGVAFRIAGICPCAPTCSIAMWPHELA